ncbi:hypothetical protein PFICI_03308 [Pestalotiopsis fici W106-1]|uniref:Tyrosine-protein phosphatase 2 n=1 Tax=Pestalotiopsis fici (strain W106-1 / CGMCC3.15140) TaxID=1229662 RepID=W3XGS7_PESFW|nr:uncharacterized protein PFICI_03308 [Pestalotiopsis fici W106-1]ETS85283.1 hypothetical protein PFICI_03308 [Pestalotiopsis fici W106-1]
MDSKSFSSRFRRNGRKGNRAASPASPASSSPGPSPVTSTVVGGGAAATGGVGADVTADDDNANNHHSASKSNSAHLTAKTTNSPPVLTITTTTDTTARPQTGNGNGNGGSSPSFFRQPKSPFSKKFHFPSRSSHKRARSPAPAALPQPTSPVLVKQDAMLDHEMMSPGKGAAATSPVQVKGGRAQGSEKRIHKSQQQQQSPRVPAFLNMSEQEILHKYQEIQWNERNRVLQSITNSSPTFKFAQVDATYRPLDRYGNIQPWNNNRVKLQVPEGNADYINASPIVLRSPLAPEQRSPHKYIAMQGPTGRTSEHVWRMVAEQMESPAVMVMLTETRENNMEKCFPYYPHNADESLDIGEHDEFQDGWRAQVKCLEVEERAEGAIEMRKLQVQVDGREDDMEVWHLLYKKWPDFGVPSLEDIGSFLDLMELSRVKNAHEDNPRIVHCSAGVGRSGTFIALEHLLREVDSGDLEKYDEHYGGEASDLVFDTVNTLREQRKMMVQAESQYLFIYKVLRKRWMEKYGLEDDQGGEPAAKRLGVGADPFVEDD